MQGMTEGRIVHYILAGDEFPGAKQGVHCPALVVKKWSPNGVNLAVFLDGSNCGWQGYPPCGPIWVTSVSEAPAENNTPGTFHEIERVY